MVWRQSRWDWIVRNKFVTCVIIFAVGLLVFGVVMVCRHWGWIVTESGSTIIRNLGLVIGGLIAIGFGIWRGVVADRQAKASQDQAKTSHHGLLNERYQKGAEMLDSEVIFVRLGGIYALQRLAREHPGDFHTQVMSLLCMFARRSPAVEELERDELSEDVLEVMEVVRRRSDAQIKIEKEEKYRLDLSEVNLSGAYLGSANLTNTDLVNANLAGANLAEASLANAKLFGALLSGAKLMKCKGLTQDTLDQARADPANPPKLDSAFDAKIGEPLEWRGGKPVR